MDEGESHDVNRSCKARSLHRTKSKPDAATVTTTTTNPRSTHSLSFASIYRAVTKETIAILTIVYTLNTATALAANYYRPHNDLDDILQPARNFSDYYDSSENYRSAARNITINTPLDQSIGNNSITPPLHRSNENDSGESLLDDLMSNVTLSKVPSTMDTMKANASLVMSSVSHQLSRPHNMSVTTELNNGSTLSPMFADQNNYWALMAIVLVIGTAAGNILVCLAITWERRLQNVTNYFLMSLAITDLMVAILVMPLGILTLFKGKFVVNGFCHFSADEDT